MAGRRGAAAAGRRRGPYFAGLPACRADRRGPAGLGDAGAFLAAGFLAAGFLADLAAGLGAGAFFGVALGLATVCGAWRVSVGRSVARARARVRHPRHRADAVTGTPPWRYRGRGTRAFFFAGAFLAAGFLALFLAGAGSSSGSALLNGLIDLKKLTMAAMVAQSGFAGYGNARL